MEIPPDLPSARVRVFLELSLADDMEGMNREIQVQAIRGDSDLAELGDTLEFAHELPLREADPIRGAAAGLAIASGTPAAYALLLRDMGRRPPDERLADLDVLLAGDPDVAATAALRVHAEGVSTDNDDLRDVCREVFAATSPGTPGVLDALLEDLGDGFTGAVGVLCAHDAPEAGPALLAWQREQADVDLLDADTALGVYGAVAAALNWGADVTDEDIARANAAAEAARLDLELEIEDLRDELEQLVATRDALRPLRRRGRLLSAGFGNAPSGSVGRNAPCPCGSGRKFKKCCE